MTSCDPRKTKKLNIKKYLLILFNILADVEENIVQSYQKNHKSIQ